MPIDDEWAAQALALARMGIFNDARLRELSGWTCDEWTERARGDEAVRARYEKAGVASDRFEREIEAVAALVFRPTPRHR